MNGDGHRPPLQNQPTAMPAAPQSVITPLSAGDSPAAPARVLGPGYAGTPELAALEMCRAVDSRLLVAAAPAEAMKLFSGLGPAYSGSTYPPNSACWLQDLRSQLTGVQMRAGGFTQSYGLQMITPRHAISCGHNGPSRNDAPLHYVNTDGTVHANSILKWANDSLGSNGGLVDSYQSPAVTDLSVYLLTSAVPEWVHKAPLLRLTAEDRTRMAPFHPPTVAISQGNWVAGPATPYGLADTPDNRMVFTKQLDLSAKRPGLRNLYHHGSYVGDSGTPEFILLGSTLHLYRVITSSTGGGVLVGDWVDYINALIGRTDAAAGISTGYTVSAKTLSQL